MWGINWVIPGPLYNITVINCLITEASIRDALFSGGDETVGGPVARCRPVVFGRI